MALASTATMALAAAAAAAVCDALASAMAMTMTMTASDGWGGVVQKARIAYLVGEFWSAAIGAPESHPPPLFLGI